MATNPNFHSTILQLSHKGPNAWTAHIDGFVTGMFTVTAQLSSSFPSIFLSLILVPRANRIAYRIQLRFMAAENCVVHSQTVQQKHFTIAGNLEIIFKSIVHSNGTVTDATDRLHETVSVLVEYGVFAGMQCRNIDKIGYSDNVLRFANKCFECGRFGRSTELFSNAC